MDHVKVLIIRLVIIVVLIFFIFVGIGLYLIYIFSHTQNMEEIKQVVRSKCQEYSKLSCKFSTSERIDFEKIYLGDEAPLGLFPHMAYIHFYSPNDPGYSKSCGGALISERWILSAAHCAASLTNVKGWVKLGSTSRIRNGPGQLFLVDQVIFHPRYNEAKELDDVLLVKLNRRVIFDSNVRPICLNVKLLSEYEHIYVAGWGRTEISNQPPEKLRYTRLYIDKKIADRCKHWRRDPYEICAGHPNSSASVYFGDSGGPLMVPYNSGCPNTYETIGITHSVENRKYFVPTETLLSWYFKVEPYIPWIVNNVWPYEPERLKHD